MLKREDRSREGIASVIALLIIVAITAFSSATLMQISKRVFLSERPMSSFYSYYKVVGNEIEILNPTPTSVSLSDIKLFVNGKLVEIEDENDNGVWEPFEKIKFTLPTDKDILSVTLYVKGNLVFDALYVHPKVIRGDMKFPKIDVNVASPRDRRDVGALKIDLDLTDDFSLATTSVVFGYKDHSERVVTYTNVLTGETFDFLRHGHHERHEREEHSGPLRFVKHYETLLRFTPNDLRNVAYVMIVAKDISGKTSTKVISLKPYVAPVSVNVESPHNGEEFYNYENIPIKVTAKNALKLQVYLDGRLVADENCNGGTCTYFTQHDPLSVGTYEVEAVAWNALYLAEDRVTFKVIRDNPPRVTIISPSNGSVFYTTSNAVRLTIKAKATDDHGVKKVLFYVDGRSIGEGKKNDGRAPRLPFGFGSHLNGGGNANDVYTISATIGLGRHVIQAVAYDTRNQKGEDSITIVVKKDYPPTVKITSPKDGSRVTESFTITATATDDRGVAKVVFYVDSVKVCEDYTAPYSCKVSKVTGGLHKISAVAYDVAGQTGSDAVNVTVDVPPTVEILKPSGNVVALRSLSQKFDVVVSAKDDFGVTKVIVKVDGKEYVAYDGSPLKAVTAYVKVTASKGRHAIEAVAYDDLNQIGSATKRILVVLAIPPKVKIVNPVGGETYNVGDPQISYVIKNGDTDVVSNLSVKGKVVDGISKEVVVGGNEVSTGTFAVIGDDKLYVPKLPTDKVKLKISVERERLYLPSILAKPKVFRGIADSLGVPIEVKTPVPATVRIIVTPLSGYAAVKKVVDDYKNCGWWAAYEAYGYKIVVPEGAKLTNATVSQHIWAGERGGYVGIRIGLDDNPPAARFSYSPKVLLKLLGNWLYRYDSKTVTVELDPNRVKQIENNFDKYFVVYDYLALSGASEPSIWIKYITTVKDVYVYDDGWLVKYARTTLGSPTDSYSYEFKIGAGTHVIKLRSGYGAFKYVVVVVPNSNQFKSGSVTVTLPNGVSKTICPGSSAMFEVPAGSVVSLKANPASLVKVNFELI